MLLTFSYSIEFWGGQITPAGVDQIIQFFHNNETRQQLVGCRLDLLYL